MNKFKWTKAIPRDTNPDIEYQFAELNSPKRMITGVQGFSFQNSIENQIIRPKSHLGRQLSELDGRNYQL